MASFVTEKVAKRYLKENAKTHLSSFDPYYEYVSPVDSSGNTSGKPRKQKRAPPPGLTKSEEKILKKVTRRAYRLDNCLNFCGIRIGWSVVVGIIPGLGDIFDLLCALLVYHTALQADIPTSLRSRMLLNIMIDFGIGLVPFLGDVADAFYRANTRNAALLYQHLRARGVARIGESEKISRRDASRTRERSRSHGRGQNRPLAIEQAPKREERTMLATAPSSAQNTHYPSSTSPPAVDPQHSRRFVTAEDIREPEKAKAHDNDKPRGNWFSRLMGSSSSGQPRDVENGDPLETPRT